MGDWNDLVNVFNTTDNTVENILRLEVENVKVYTDLINKYIHLLNRNKIYIYFECIFIFLQFSILL